MYFQFTNEIRQFSNLTNQSGGSYLSSPPFSMFNQEQETLQMDLLNTLQ